MEYEAITEDELQKRFQEALDAARKLYIDSKVGPNVAYDDPRNPRPGWRVWNDEYDRNPALLPLDPGLFMMIDEAEEKDGHNGICDECNSLTFAIWRYVDGPNAETWADVDPDLDLPILTQEELDYLAVDFIMRHRDDPVLIRAALAVHTALGHVEVINDRWRWNYKNAKIKRLMGD